MTTNISTGGDFSDFQIKEISSYQRGANPLLQTKRGKVQQRRCALNEQISKQIRLRNGAENLLRATNDKKIRDQIALELSFLDSNLQLLKEELAELNTDVQIYQNDTKTDSKLVPMLALGLKETKDVDFVVPFKDVIIEHYAEDDKKYDKPIKVFSDMRKSIRTPPRNESGIKLLHEFYNHLCFVEKRFFPPNRPLSIYFEWYDAVTGIPAIQRSIAFEKGSILFNVGALCSQLAANEDRSTQIGLEKSAEYYSRAAGFYHYLKENFSHSPSVDMSSDTLDALIHLFLAQVQECVWEICNIQLSIVNGFQESFMLAQESSQVSKMYVHVCKLFNVDAVKQYLPPAWLALATVKRDHYKALAHFFTAVGILAMRDTSDEVRKRFRVHFVNTNLQLTNENFANSPLNSGMPPENSSERRLLARIHYRTAIFLSEECSSAYKLNKQLRKLNSLNDYLQKYHDIINKKQRELDDEDDFADLYEGDPIVANSNYPAAIIVPDFKKYKIVDLFRELGPLSIFNVRNDLAQPRIVKLKRTARCPGFGFSVKGDAPVSISAVEPGGLAALCGLNSGDLITAVGEENCKWSSHDDVVQMIRRAGDCLTLTIVSQRRHSLSSSAHSLSTLSSNSSSNNNWPANSNANNNSVYVQSIQVNKNNNANWLSSSTLPTSFKKLEKTKKPKNVQYLMCSCFSNKERKGKPHLTFESIKNLKEKKKLGSWGVKGLLTLKKRSKSEPKLADTTTIYR